LHPLSIREHRFDWSRAYLVGVLNTTPDSFSDGGLYHDPQAAVTHARALLADGADIIDIGGESTRPGAQPVTAADEIARTVPVIRELRALGVRAPLSIDTSKAEVARAALEAGADIVNDISGGRFDPDIVAVAERAEAPFICGHVRGDDLAEVHAAEAVPITAEEVAFELCERVAALPTGVRARAIVDPCLGFGKRADANLELIRWSGQLARATRCPVMIGPSRKRFIRALVQPPAATPGTTTAIPEARRRADSDAGTVAACLAAVSYGAHFLRVHNIELLRPAIMVYEAIKAPLR
jgi:dihydropteroate synthase